MSALEFELHVRCPRGTVLVGGYTPPPGELDAVHARYGDDGPAIVPASALRGALRESFESLLRGAEEPACCGGDGLDPTKETGAREPVPCTLDGGRPCRACRLFGTQRAGLSPGERAFSALVLEDAVAESADHPWVIGHGVAVDRRRRSAREGLLFNRRTPAPGPGLTFVARGRLLDPAMKTDFEAAAVMAQHLGGGRSRGLGRVDLVVRWRETTSASVPPIDGEDVRIVVELQRPACVGVPFAHENLRTTRREIPGGALRGAVGFALAERLPDPDGDEAFQTLVEGDGEERGRGAIFDFLYPARPDAPEVGPWPVTARQCKVDARHAAVDTLLDRLAAAFASTAEEAVRVDDTSADRCPDCGEALKARQGYRGHEGRVPTRIVTRVELNRRLRSAREGRLFSYELIAEGATFVGSIRSIPAGSRGRLAEALSAPLSLGRGRAMGWGRVRLRVEPMPKRASLTDRATAFEQAVARRFQRAGLAPPAPGRLVQLTLSSPLLPRDGDGTADLAAALGLDEAACVLKARRFGVEGGWDQREPDIDRQTAHQSVAAGAVYVFQLPEGLTWRDLGERIERLERDGAGQRRHQGFGRVLAFDPAVVEGERR